MQIHTLTRGLAMAALALASQMAQAQATVYGWQLAGGWPAAHLSANADWSSDLGPDYRFGAGLDNTGTQVAWSGQGSHWSDRPYSSTNESDLTLGWQGTARGGAVGQTFSGGVLDIGPSLTLNGATVASTTIHLWSELGANEPGYGISTDARFNSYAAILLGPTPLDLHWRLDWVSTTTGNAQTSAYLYFAGVFSQAIGGTTGSASGHWAYGGSPAGVWSVPDVAFTSSAGDSAGDPRAGRIDTWVTISFATQPIAAPVPEPATWALMAGGTALLLRWRRKPA